MPDEYKDAKVMIYCNDCEQVSKSPFHVLGAKCLLCRSYNTMREKGPLIYDDEDDSNQNQNSDEQIVEGQPEGGPYDPAEGH